MKLTVIQMLKSGSGKQRGLVCRAPDGGFQFVILTRVPDTEGADAQWTAGAPSELFDQQDKVVEALTTAMPGIALLQDVEPQEIDIPTDSD